MTEQEKRRLERAKEMAKELKEGTYFPPSFDTAASWWPKREIIKKDLTKLYGVEEVKK